MSAPKLDEEVKEQLKIRGKDPHYGSEKSLYKLQEQVLDVAGPLRASGLISSTKKPGYPMKMCSFLFNEHCMVLLGSECHAISLE